jgi:hypothetical protein
MPTRRGRPRPLRSPSSSTPVGLAPETGAQALADAGTLVV